MIIEVCELEVYIYVSYFMDIDLFFNNIYYYLCVDFRDFCLSILPYNTPFRINLHHTTNACSTVMTYATPHP